MNFIFSKKTKTNDKKNTLLFIIRTLVSSPLLFANAVFGESDDGYRQHEDHTGVYAAGTRLQDRKGKRTNTQEYRQRVINLINKLELSTYGKKATVSGGYVHVEYRYLLSRAFEIYPYAESQWAESRGMEYKISTGLQSRYRLVNKEKFLMFAAAGLFYEFEKWDDPSPNPARLHAYSRSIKSHLSVSCKHHIGDHWELTTTAIHQAKPDSYFKAARFGGAVDLNYNITPKIGINGAYRLIYDTDPIVPIRKTYTTAEAGLNISF